MKNKSFNRVISFLMVMILSVSLFGCGEKPLEISEEEAFEVLKTLVPQSYDLNVIFFGAGLPAVDEGYAEEHTGTAYYKVREDCAYKTVSSIKAAAEKVYSKRYLSGIYIVAFEGIASESTDGNLDTTFSPRYKEIGGSLHVDLSYGSVDIKGRLEVVSSRIIEKTPQYIKLEMSYTDNGEGGKMNVFITLENGVWLLDGPTY